MEHPVNQALQRPKLLRGGEHKYSLWNLLFVFYLLCRTIMSHNWWLILGVIFFAWPVQWMIRWLSKDDPMNISTYFESVKAPLVLEPTE